MKTNGSTNARTPVSCYLSSWNVRLSLYFSTRPRLPNTPISISKSISKRKKKERKEKKKKRMLFHSNIAFQIPSTITSILSTLSITFALHQFIQIHYNNTCKPFFLNKILPFNIFIIQPSPNIIISID